MSWQRPLRGLCSTADRRRSYIPRFRRRVSPAQLIAGGTSVGSDNAGLHAENASGSLALCCTPPPGHGKDSACSPPAPRPASGSMRRGRVQCERLLESSVDLVILRRISRMIRFPLAAQDTQLPLMPLELTALRFSSHERSRAAPPGPDDRGFIDTTHHT